MNFGNNYVSHSRRETNMNKNNVILLVGHSAGALPLCLPNNYQWNSKTRQCVKTEEKRSSLCFVEDSLRELRKIKSTGLFSISDKKYLKCKKF